MVIYKVGPYRKCCVMCVGEITLQLVFATFRKISKLSSTFC